MPDPSLDEWVTAYAAELTGGPRDSSRVRWLTPPSGAVIAIDGPVVAKFHHERTDERGIANRLTVIGDPLLEDVFVQPLDRSPARAPNGRLVTWWPLVELVAAEADEYPWASAGRLLARLHAIDPAALSTRAVLPPAGTFDRLRRAVARAAQLASPAGMTLSALGERLLHEVSGRHPATSAAPSLVHGDWHLGQLGRSDRDSPWLLLDIDDVGIGDPSWDLGRPAGFWATGLLSDQEWSAFIESYRDAGGPAVPGSGPLWEPLDLAARCAVLMAAVRTQNEPQARGDGSAAALLTVCEQM